MKYEQMPNTKIIKIKYLSITLKNHRIPTIMDYHQVLVIDADIYICTLYYSFSSRNND